MVLHSDLVENSKPAGIVPWALPHIFPAAVEELHVTSVGPVAFPENITIFFINGYCRIYIQSYCQGWIKFLIFCDHYRGHEKFSVSFRPKILATFIREFF